MTWQVKWRNHNKKQRLETSVHPQIQKISRINDSNGKTKYLGRTFTNNEVALEQCWIREIFEFSEPDFYKQVTMERCDETQHKTYNVPVGWCSLNTSQEKHNYLDMHYKAFTSLGKSNKKKEQVPDVPIIKYSQSIQKFMYYIILGIGIVLYGRCTCVRIYH